MLARHFVLHEHDFSKAKCPKRDCQFDKKWIGEYQEIASSFKG